MPTYTRHPVAMGQQAASTQLACEGRFTLGIGLAHKFMVEDAWGLSYDKPASHMRAYLDVLMPLMHRQSVQHESEHYRVNLQPPPAPADTSVLVAALGPAMLKLTGEVADGTITWATGPRTLADHIVPGLNNAASAAGRETPRVVAGFPVLLTDKVDEARELAAKTFAIYAQVPSYRAMLDREGVDGLGDLAIVGDENEIAIQIKRLESLGVTDLLVFPYELETGEAARTASYLAEIR